MNTNDLLAADAFDRLRRRALEQWQTGDLVTGARLFWAGPRGPDPIVGLDGTQVAGPSTAWEVRTLAAEPGEIAIVISQTCDVAGTGPGARSATVQVSPVVSLAGLDGGKLREIQLGLHNDFVHLTAPPAEGHWAADLRISMPVSKTLLLGGPPRHAFENPEETLAFSERVAQRFRRPALHDDLTGLMIPSLRRLFAEPGADSWKYDIEQVRLLVLEGSRLAPADVRLLVLTEASKVDRKHFDAWRAQMARTLRKQEAAIRLSPSLWQQVEAVRVPTYRASVPLRLPELGRRDFW